MVFKQPISISKRTTPQHRYDHTSSISAAPTPNLLTPLNNLLRKPHLIDEHRPDSSRRQPVVVVCYFFCVKTFTEYFHGRRASRELHESMEKESGGNTNSHTPASLHVSGVGAVRVPQRCESGTLLSASSRRDTTVVGGVAPLGSICMKGVYNNRNRFYHFERNKSEKCSCVRAEC